MQLKVVKTDGTVEEYLHTKVIGAINNALGRSGQADISIAEELAEVVTYYLYHKQDKHNVTSGEVFSIIKAVLTATGYEEAAAALSEHFYERKLKRSRIEVVPVDIQELTDTEILGMAEQLQDRSRWDKATIVNDLVTKQGLSRQIARTIASMVEEKIFNVGITLVPVSLIKQLVLGDTAAVLRAQRQLLSV
ncbi:MAG: ATP cone domain-containing protein [Sedimentisphaerales bacterium]|nr:ATP cone domain-containing protein [Sedimentisphaerales bacterium]